jgi:DNA primase
VAGLIPDQILEQVRQANDVVEVISSYFPLKRAGANFRALCPFHKEKTPSFNVNAQKQIWHCFGCGEGGDVFKFVMKYENLDFTASVRRLAERAGVRVEFEEAKGGPSRDEKELLIKLHEQAAAFFHEYLLKDKAAEQARAYLKKRAITLETVRKWRIGYAPDSWDALMQWAKARKFSPALLETAGLVLRSERGPEEPRFYDRFRGRLMFPICDEQGRVVAFSGRILTGVEGSSATAGKPASEREQPRSDRDQPKYVNSPETAIFQKGRLLFALDKAKRAIIEAKEAIVCEGQIDTISCHEAGFENVVAPQGTAFTEQHARILKRYADEVVLMFDSDEAGQKAAVRSAEPLWNLGFILRVALLPAGDDPDSFVKKFGAEKLRELIDKAPRFLTFLLERLVRQHDAKTDRGKVQIMQEVVGWLCRVQSPTLQATYAQQIAGLLDVREEVVRQEMRRFHRGQRSEPGLMTESASDTPAAGASPPAEEMLLHLMLNDERVVETVAERLDPAWLSDSNAARLIACVLALHARKAWTGPAVLLDSEKDDAASRLISKLLLRSVVIHDHAAAAADCLATLELRWMERQGRELQKRLAQAGLSGAEMAKVQQQLLDLRRKLDNIHPLSRHKRS